MSASVIVGNNFAPLKNDRIHHRLLCPVSQQSALVFAFARYFCLILLRHIDQ